MRGSLISKHDQLVHGPYKGIWRLQMAFMRGDIQILRIRIKETQSILQALLQQKVL